MSASQIMSRSATTDLIMAPLPPVLDSLPTEMWLLIVSHLDPISAARLALTGRALEKIVGPEAFHAFAQLDDQNLKLQFLLSFPPAHHEHYWLCATCYKWHALRRPFWFSKLQYPNLDCTRRPPTVDLAEYEVSISILRAMSAIRYDASKTRYGAPITDYARRWNKYRYSWVSLSAKVIHGSLLVKTSMQLRLNTSATNEKSEVRAEVWNVCHHSSSRIQAYLQSLIAIVDLLPVYYDSNQNTAYRRFCSERYRCTQCPSEYAVEVERPTAKIVTWTYTIMRWTDLGTCEHTRSPHFCSLLPHTNLDKEALGSAVFDFSSALPIRDRFEKLNVHLHDESQGSDLLVPCKEIYATAFFTLRVHVYDPITPPLP